MTVATSRVGCSSAGTSLATGLPRLVMVIVSPFSTRLRSQGRCVLASYDPTDFIKSTPGLNWSSTPSLNRIPYFAKSLLVPVSQFLGHSANGPGVKIPLGGSTAKECASRKSPALTAVSQLD